MDADPGDLGAPAAPALYTGSTTRLLQIVRLVAAKPISTSYELAKALELPVSSTYLAVNELERLGWLTHDEDGNLVVGPRAQQVALSAVGYRVPPQQLAPIVRYLRDQTGETAFAGHLGADLRIGAFLHGFNPNSVTFAPSERFGDIAPMLDDPDTGLRHFHALRPAAADSPETRVEILTATLSQRPDAARSEELVVGVCWVERKTEITGATDLLLEVLKHRDALTAPVQ